MKTAFKFKQLLLGTALIAYAAPGALADDAGPLNKIKTVVVIYAENRSFDNLYGNFPGANGLQNVKPEATKQLDRDGSVMATLPKVWGGATGKGVTPAVTEDQTANLANQAFAIDDPKGLHLAMNFATRDLWHRFYQEQMQIDGGKNDKFAAWADAGGLVMGTYDGSTMPMWAVSKKYVLADNFFMGAFGGSFLNHFALVCACVPKYPNAETSPAKGLIAESPAKLRRILQYFAAVQGSGPYPQVRCNAPEFSAVIGASGQVQPCFFIAGPAPPPVSPSASQRDLKTVLNSEPMTSLRSSIRAGARRECKTCVCTLYRPEFSPA